MHKKIILIIICYSHILETFIKKIDITKLFEIILNKTNKLLFKLNRFSYSICIEFQICTVIAYLFSK
jgi:hypothetical protein